MLFIFHLAYLQSDLYSTKDLYSTIIQITPRWKTFADELIENRIQCPMIKRVNCFWNLYDVFEIGLVFPSAYRRFFGILNKQSTGNNANGWSKIDVSEDSFVSRSFRAIIMHFDTAGVQYR